MLDHLFPRARSRMLSFLMLLGDESRHLREIARLTGLPTMAVQRELARFEKLGLVHSELRGRQKYFTVDTSHPLYPELRGMVLKTSGLAEPLREVLSGLTGVRAAAVFGSMASGAGVAASDIDLMVVGEVDEPALSGALEGVERTLGRKVNYVLMSARELRRRRKQGEPFLTRVLGGALIPIVGDLNAL
jgi:predicted nucleotidyltransferase